MKPRIWQRCSFADWLELCDMMDSWDENLRTMRYCDWIIHRKLGEEAGLAHRYIIPARGSGKSLFVVSFDDPKKILRKHQVEPEPQEFVTIKDGDVERWLREERDREWVDRFYETIVNHEKRGNMKKLITTHNPYWDFNPLWTVDDDGNFTIKELSYIPNYRWDTEVL